MLNCTVRHAPFSKFKRREFEVRFDGGDVSADGGPLLLRQLEWRSGLLKQGAHILPTRAIRC